MNFMSLRNIVFVSWLLYVQATRRAHLGVGPAKITDMMLFR